MKGRGLDDRLRPESEEMTFQLQWAAERTIEGVHRHIFMKPGHAIAFNVHPVALEMSFILNLQSQSHWSFFNGTWQKRPRQLDHRLRF